MKRNMNCAESGRLAELLDLEATNMVQPARTEDHREAARRLSKSAYRFSLVGELGCHALGSWIRSG
jgi:hypothetical protein